MTNEMLFHEGERDHVHPSCVFFCQEIIYKNERPYLINVGRHFVIFFLMTFIRRCYLKNATT